jgi:hypothetical protein
MTADQSNGGLPPLPTFLQRLSTDEYEPLPYSTADRLAVSAVRSSGPATADRLGIELKTYWSGRLGTAAGLLALDSQERESFYRELSRDRCADALHFRQRAGDE